MPEKPPSYFENCRCPRCRHSLHEVLTTQTSCPACGQHFEARDVWMTRTYPGLIMLPGWLKAFGWPFLLMVAGFAMVGAAYAFKVAISLKVPAALIALGMVFFIYKLATDGEEL